MSQVLRNYTEWLAWMRRNVWSNSDYAPPAMQCPRDDEYPMICNTVYSQRRADYSDVDRVSLRDFTDEICPLLIAADKVLTDKQLNTIHEKLREDVSEEESISGVVNDLLEHIEYLDMLLHDLRLESTAYEQGKRDGVRGVEEAINKSEKEIHEKWLGTH